jgi:hypothetical protein
MTEYTCINMNINVNIKCIKIVWGCRYENDCLCRFVQLLCKRGWCNASLNTNILYLSIEGDTRRLSKCCHTNTCCLSAEMENKSNIKRKN